MFIETQNQLDDVMGLIECEDIIGIDTEFMRTKTFWPDLCLLQISTKNKVFIIDVCRFDASQVLEKINSLKVLKLFHSARQDVEAIWYKYGILIKNIFDTQVAASFLGMNLSISYADLVKIFFNVEIDKSQQFIEWDKRPLTLLQVDYAGKDVQYLIPIYIKLRNELKKDNKIEWVITECHEITKVILSIDDKYMCPIKNNIFKWRENICRFRNITRKTILSNESLSNLVRNIPHENFLIDNPYREIIYEIYKESHKIKNDNYYLNVPKDIFKSIEEVIQKVSHKYSIPTQVLARKSDVKKIILQPLNSNRILEGWRNEILGKEILKLLIKS